MTFDLEAIIRDTVSTDWRDVLLDIARPYSQAINAAINEDIHTYTPTLQILPPSSMLFKAFNCFNISETKAIILSQDPYPTRGHAMGLCFSVPQGTKPIPPSLRNIFKELHHEFGTERTSSDLTDWATQGVLMLNTALTVLEGNAGKHLALWKPFTTDIIKFIARDQRIQHVVYMLWGQHAKSIAQYVNAQNENNNHKHLILTHTHPSPLSRKPFVGNNHFRLANIYLEKHGKSPIQWC